VAKSPGWVIARERLLSIDRVAVNAEEKRTLSGCGAGAVEMEAAGVSERARKWRIPFYGIRVITDTASEGFSIDFNRMRDSNGRFSRSRIIKEACRDPFRLFPELMQFDRRCRSAARVLGDFIADCQF
jgi:nucleoside phosphorylase